MGVERKRGDREVAGEIPEMDARCLEKYTGIHGQGRAGQRQVEGKGRNES